MPSQTPSTPFILVIELLRPPISNWFHEFWYRGTYDVSERWILQLPPWLVLPSVAVASTLLQQMFCHSVICFLLRVSENGRG